MIYETNLDTIYLDPNVDKDENAEARFVVYESSLAFKKEYYHWIINRLRKRLNYYDE